MLSFEEFVQYSIRKEYWTNILSEKNTEVWNFIDLNSKSKHRWQK